MDSNPVIPEVNNLLSNLLKQRLKMWLGVWGGVVHGVFIILLFGRELFSVHSLNTLLLAFLLFRVYEE